MADIHFIVPEYPMIAMLQVRIAGCAAETISVIDNQTGVVAAIAVICGIRAADPDQPLRPDR